MTLFERIPTMYDFTILLLKGAYRTSVATTLDILEAAAEIAPLIHTPAPRWRVISCDGDREWFTNETSEDDSQIESEHDTSTWVIPGLGSSSIDSVLDRLTDGDIPPLITALQSHSSQGGKIAASCSAVFLLQAAGLLSGRTVTTAWRLAPSLAKLEPQCTVDADLMICQDANLITAGAAFAQIDLMLHLISDQLGSRLTDAVARVLLLNKRDAQAPFIAPEMLSTKSDLVSSLTREIEESLPEVPKAKDLASALFMSERTLARKVVDATGKSTLSLIQSVRLRRARVLLETTDLSVEQIAEKVGYQDGSALRRLMRKVTGSNPSQFRTKRRIQP